jgi:hypothetical protein
VERRPTGEDESQKGEYLADLLRGETEKISNSFVTYFFVYFAY